MRLWLRKKNNLQKKSIPKAIKKIFENRKQILEGIKNKLFKKEHVEAIAKDRWQICIKCESLDVVGDKCTMPGTQPCCGECGCSMGFKLRSLFWRRHVD